MTYSPTRPTCRFCRPGQRLVAVVMMVAMVSGAPAPRADDNAAAAILLRNLETKLGKVTTVQTAFRQEKQLAMFKHTLVLTGEIAVGPDGRIAWHVHEPVRYVLVIQDKQVRQWDEDTGRVQKLDLRARPAFEAVFQQLSVWFSGRYVSLLDDYAVTILDDAPVTVQFAPKADAALHQAVDAVIVTFRQDQRYIEQLQIREGGGDVTTIHFHDTRLNEPINAKVWKVPPDGD